MFTDFTTRTLIVNETTGFSVNVENSFVRLNIAEVLQEHFDRSGDLDLNKVTHVCLCCGSIGETVDLANRDRITSDLDLTCHRNQTYSFVSNPAGFDTLT